MAVILRTHEKGWKKYGEWDGIKDEVIDQTIVNFGGPNSEQDDHSEVEEML
jgi:hypothetical protein